MHQVTETVLHGDRPIAVRPGLLTPLPREGWSARVRSLHLDGASVDYLEVDPFRYEVAAVEARPSRRAARTLLVVLQGRAVGEVDGRETAVEAKDAALLDEHVAVRLVAAERLRAVRLLIDEEHLRSRSAGLLPAPFVLLKDGPLVSACVGFITGLLRTGCPIVDPIDATAVSGTLVALQRSLLAPGLHRRPDDRRGGVDPLRRRHQIEQYVQEHLADRDLSPTAIAAALGVALRTVHAAYDGDAETVAGMIRSRRVARAQTLLAVRREPPNVSAMADRVGLSRDQLTRAFQRETGQTVPQWWEGHRPR